MIQYIWHEFAHAIMWLTPLGQGLMLFAMACLGMAIYYKTKDGQ